MLPQNAVRKQIECAEFADGIDDFAYGLAEEELYRCAAQWSGLYDRMHTHEPDEIYRRLALAADYGEILH